MENPWKKCVTLAVANTVYNLLELMQTVDASISDSQTYHDLQLHVDPAWGGTFVLVGNSDVADDCWGKKLIPTQYDPNYSRYNNGRLSDIYLMAKGAADCLVGVNLIAG